MFGKIILSSSYKLSYDYMTFNDKQQINNCDKFKLKIFINIIINICLHNLTQ